MQRHSEDIFEVLAEKCGCEYVSDLRIKAFAKVAKYHLKSKAFKSRFTREDIERAKAYIRMPMP